VLKKTYAYPLRTVLVLGARDEPVCRLNLCVVRGLFGTRLVSLPFSDYGGPLMRDANLSEISSTLATAIDSLALEYNASYILFKSTEHDLPNYLAPRGYDPIHHLGTYIVSLNDRPSEIERKFHTSVRRRAKRIARDGMEFVDEQGETSIKRFYQVYLRDMRRHGSPPHSLKYFQAIWKEFGSSGGWKLFSCKNGDENLGYALHFLYGKTVLFYVGVWPGRARKMGVAPFLIANSIRFFAEEGYQLYDFGRTPHPSAESLFKQSFGGEYRSQNALVKSFNGGRNLAPSNWRYRVLSSLLWYTPLSLLSRIGPQIKEQLE